MSIYVRMLSIRCGMRIDWKAAQAEFDTYFADEEDTNLDPDALDQLRYVLEHPADTDLRAFVHAKRIFYLAVGPEHAPPEALEALWAFDEAETVLEAAGLTIVSTMDDYADWTRPEKIKARKT